MNTLPTLVIALVSFGPYSASLPAPVAIFPPTVITDPNAVVSLPTIRRTGPTAATIPAIFTINICVSGLRFLNRSARSLTNAVTFSSDGAKAVIAVFAKSASPVFKPLVVVFNWSIGSNVFSNVLSVAPNAASKSLTPVAKSSNET